MEKKQTFGDGSERRALIERLDSQFSKSAVSRRKRRHLSGSLALVGWVNLLSAVRRLTDICVASATLLLCAPVMLTLFAYAVNKGGGISRTRRLGRWAVPFDELAFNLPAGPARMPLSGLPALFNVLRGDLSLIGPRAVSPDTINSGERLAWRRYNVRPGLLCLWWIRQRTNIAYGSETEVDSEYIDQRALLGDVGIALRAVPAALYGQNTPVIWTDRISLLGIPVDNLTMDEAIDYMVRPATSNGTRQVCFVNADCVNIAFRNGEYHRLLNQASLVLGDGIGVKIAGRILNQPIRQNVNGTDLFPRLCAELARLGLGIYLLGGKPGVAADVVKWIEQHHPTLRVDGFRHGYFTAEEEADVIADIANSGAQVLLVAFGAPKQEQWIERNLKRLRVPMASGVGGLFDFYSGRIPRAPVWLREIGFEWLYRFLQEPKRMWRRYFVGNGVFLLRVLKERSRAQNPAGQF